MADPVDIGRLVRDLEAPEAARRRDALIGLTAAGHDVGFMVERCVVAAGEAEAEVRAAAMQCLGELARIHLKLPIGKVLPVIEAGRHDSNQQVRDQAETAFGDIERYVLDPPTPDESSDGED